MSADDVQVAPSSDPGHGPVQFVQTRWSVVLGAKDGSFEALSQLCAWYREPLRRHLLRRGCTEHQADDLIQDFLSRKMAHGSLFRSVQDPTLVGKVRRFRTFLLTCLDRFLIEHHRRRRDPADPAVGIPLGVPADDHDQALDLPGPPVTQVEEAVARADWAETVLKLAEDRHRKEFLDAGKPAEAFELFNASYGRAPEARPGTEMARILGLTENALYVAKHRFAARRAFWLKEMVKETVAHSEDWENEVRDLLGGDV